MPTQKRHKIVKYPGVYYIEGKAVGANKKERIYYIMYRKNGKLVEEKAGRQFQDDMTPAKAANIRVNRIEGELTNQEKRKKEEAEREALKNRWTVEKLWEAYKSNNPKLKGVVTDQNRFDNYIKPNFGSKEPKEIIPLDTDRLRINLLKKKSPGTVKNVLELLRRITNFGVKKNLCEGLCFTIEMPKVNNTRTEDLTPTQLKNLIKVIESSSNVQAANLMKLVLFTGMRRSECFRLKWSHVNFKKGFIKLVFPKGGVDQEIPLNNEARQLLEGHPRTKSEYVFPGRGGRQRTDIKKQVNKIKDDAGIPKDFRALHGLRHVYASMLASSGKVDMYTLQKLLTHKSPQMTQRYAHLRDEALKSASDLAGEIMSGAMNRDDKVVSLENENK
jgi:integrase